MLIIPAIDIKEGKVVRLFKGDYKQVTTYDMNPIHVAKEFSSLGADYIHLVDLNGAKDGFRVNERVIMDIRKSVSTPIEIGGGIRNLETISFYLDEIKVNRVILGTVALKNKPLLIEAIQRFSNEKIVVGVDIKDGFVATEGWLDKSDVNYLDFLKELENIGVKYVVVTDISKDGTLMGPNFELYETIKKVTNLMVVVSGGISCEEDIYKVKNQYGCIIGKAYYDGKIRLKEVITCLKKESFPV